MYIYVHSLALCLHGAARTCVCRVSLALVRHTKLSLTRPDTTRAHARETKVVAGPREGRHIATVAFPSGRLNHRDWARDAPGDLGEDKARPSMHARYRSLPRLGPCTRRRTVSPMNEMHHYPSVPGPAPRGSPRCARRRRRRRRRRCRRVLSPSTCTTTTPPRQSLTALSMYICYYRVPCPAFPFSKSCPS